ncbi:polysaccharide deacetylase [Thermococcus kodakarensis KOD1]|uniref:Polysaccharide deacetylase n=1 Tax=Thermococcus kodakarensis (strain ATCC BAA-918 / JCM 12380 / KOD1) TaxID=69014 RepID=Q5JI61_THEKO|nr:polysaccharide deacetylase family protein [Thermococcus kodakarensis]WCN28884.1 polysaccharide deacetylase family protein [Thermococcus kodakarensis]WCN31186.1 polysaccharide deacetylase family protein [Thermococcus kodakarensis]BAD85081.1 polysaccharide deacetylase [Thermococcus kodakarensis KOD1]
MGQVILTFDVEQDCPPFASSTRGMEEGLPLVMDLLEDSGIKGTFLFTGRMAEKFPELARRAAKKHELGCHGLEHERFDRLPGEEVRRRLSEAREILSRFGKVVSFRAPNFQFPDDHYPILKELGFLVDSTKAKHKGWRRGVTEISGLLEVPATTTSIVTRLPWTLQKPFHKRFEDPIVYIFHPWEFVRMSKRLRPDCWFGTGKSALENLRRLIEFHISRDAEFLTLREFYHEYQKLKREGEL